MKELENKINEIGYLGYIEDEHLFIVYPKMITIKLPKKKKVDLKWCLERIEKRLAKVNQNNFKLFQRLVNHIFGKESLDTYATSYGIGIFNIVNLNKDNQIKKIKEFLTKNKIKFKTEYSDKAWVYRFVISQNKENLKKLNLALDKD